MIDCEHNKDNIYNIWEAPKKTKLYKNELLRYYQILSYIPKNVKKVLDLGCGTGFMSYLLATNGYDVTSIDKSSERLSCFTDIAKKNNIMQVNADMFKYCDNEYDFIICQEVIEHISEYQKVIAKIHSLLAVGSYATITTPYKENLQSKTKKCNLCGEYYHTSGHLHSFDENKLLNACIENNFNVQKTSLIVSNRSIKLFAYFDIPVNNFTIIIDKLFNKLFPKKAAYLLLLIKKESV